MSVPSSVVPERNSTLAMVPSLSDALAAIAIVAGAVNVAPDAGAEIDTDGKVFGAGLTVTEAAVEVVIDPSLSVARAVNEYVPAATFVHPHWYGADVSVPRSVEPE